MPNRATHRNIILAGTTILGLFVAAAAGIQSAAADPLPSELSELTVTTTSDPPSGSVVYPGQTITYTTTIVNTGDAFFDLVDFLDDVSDLLVYADFVDDPPLMTINGAEACGAPYIEGVNVVMKCGLGPEDVAVISYQFVVKPGLETTKPLRNSVTVAGYPEFWPIMSNCATGNEPECRSVLTLATPGLDVALTSDPVSGSQVLGRQVITYALTAKNTGTIPLEDVTLTNDIAGVLEHGKLDTKSITAKIDGSPGDSGSLSGTTLIWQGKLAAGQTAVVTYKITLNSDAKLGVALINKVTGTGVALAYDSGSGSLVPGKNLESNCSTGDESRCRSSLTSSRPDVTIDVDTGGSIQPGHNNYALALAGLALVTVAGIRLSRRVV